LGQMRPLRSGPGPPIASPILGTSAEDAHTAIDRHPIVTLRFAATASRASFAAEKATRRRASKEESRKPKRAESHVGGQRPGSPIQTYPGPGLNSELAAIR